MKFTRILAGVCALTLFSAVGVAWAAQVVSPPASPIGAATAGTPPPSVTVDSTATASMRAPVLSLPAVPALAWERRFPGVTFRESSPATANLGRPAVVVGALDGNLYGFDVRTGANVPGWPVHLGKPINSSPATADLYGTGRDDVVVGTGIADGSQCGGGFVAVIDAAGVIRWERAGIDGVCKSQAFHSSPTLGDVTGGGKPDITIGALGLQSWSWDSSGQLNPGWPYYTDDTVFATSALADLDGDGHTEIIMGGDSSPGGLIDYRGGLVRAVTGDGHTEWQFFTDEMVRSSPAVGDLAGDGRLAIVFGTGNYWAAQPGGAKDSDKVFAVDVNGNLSWVRNLGGQTIAGPALADVAGDGQRDVVIGTADGPQGGLVWVLGPDGTPLPHWGGVPSGGGVVIGGISTADLNGDGAQDLLVPTGSGVFARDGRTGQLLFSLDAARVGFQSTPDVSIDPDGRIGITVAGTTAYGEGVVQHWVMPRSSGATLGAGWPTFHHDNRRTGNTDPPPLTDRRCLGTSAGYWEAGADGGVFGWCSAGYHGSGTGLHLAAPIVGIASTPSGRGYWTVASDGGVFAYGDARYYGSPKAPTLSSPIVGIARTTTGRGYWLVTAAGAVYAYGDAVFYGGAGSVRVPFRVVAILASPKGTGYWLVGAQGTVLTYGQAPFFGSSTPLALSAPIVGGAPTPSGLGYWLVSSDGGVFTYGDAAYLGSMGRSHLNAPITAMAATAAGRGYWLMSTDGGVFTFGDARWVGSMAGRHTNGRVVALAVAAG